MEAVAGRQKPIESKHIFIIKVERERERVMPQLNVMYNTRIIIASPLLSTESLFMPWGLREIYPSFSLVFYSNIIILS